MIILGIDPGTATTGYGIIKIKKRSQEIKFLGCGCIKTSPTTSAQDRLKEIYNELNRIIKEHKPRVLAIESLYFFKNAKTVIGVSQARGVTLLAASRKKLPIYEFTPLQVKMNITGYGRAEKKQMQKKMKIVLKLKEIPKPDDAADALGAAVTLAYMFFNKKLPLPCKKRNTLPAPQQR